MNESSRSDPDPVAGRLPVRTYGVAQSDVNSLHSAPTGSMMPAPTPPPGCDTPISRGGKMPCEVGDYDILEEIAVGGMGVVYKARRKADTTVVALKMMRPDIAGKPEQAQRFHREILAAARLHHANIVPILDVGWHEGRPFYTMPFCSGNLSRLRKQATPDVKTLAVVMEKIAQGVQHAHVQNILHRDLKPANILLDAQNEPTVTDFGLAKLHDADLELTRTGTVMGTWPYMSPEQALGRTREFGPATDIWALGVILYELLAGRRPFLGQDDSELSDAIVNGQPPPLRVLRPELPWQLERIVQRCLHKKPTRRYATAAAFAEDLRRWLRGEPLQRQRPSRRVVVMAALVALLVVGLALAITFAFAFAPRPGGEKTPVKQILIGETGPASSGRLLAGDKNVVVADAAQEAFSLTSKSIVLWELAQEAPSKPYRFEAEVRLGENEVGEAGLYLGHAELDGRRFFWKLAFSEINGSSGSVSLGFRLFDPLSTLPLGGPRKSFVPGKPPEFHHVAIEVGAESAIVFWDRKQFGEVSLKMFQASQVDRFVGLPASQIDFFPKGSLGLYVQQGTAAFRNCKLEWRK